MTKHEADVIGGLNMTDQISNEAYKQIMIAAQDENEVGDVLDKIRAEIEGLTYYWCEVHPKSVIDDVLQIIDKYKAENEGMDRKTLGEDICECGHHFPKCKYDFCPICGSEFGIIDRYRNEVRE